MEDIFADSDVEVVVGGTIDGSDGSEGRSWFGVLRLFNEWRPVVPPPRQESRATLESSESASRSQTADRECGGGVLWRRSRKESCNNHRNGCRSRSSKQLTSLAWAHAPLHHNNSAGSESRSPTHSSVMSRVCTHSIVSTRDACGVQAVRSSRRSCRSLRTMNAAATEAAADGGRSE